MNEIDFISVIKREKLDECNYFKTLIEEGYNNNLITDEELTNIQMQLLQLLDERIYKYNGFDSSSIRTEMMEEISESNLYTISIYLKTFRILDEALKFIKTKGIKIAYQEGRKKIDKILNVIKIMYIKVKQNMIDVQNYTYNDTIIEGIKGFLKIYDPDFKAQDMKITADYPLYNNLIGKLEGVEFIKEYINSIYLENMFCSKFSLEKIRHLLHGFADDYKDLIINIFEIVFIETLGCKLVKRNIQDLTISTSELNEIYIMFKNKNKREVKQKIIETYEKIKEEMLLDNREISKYIEKNLDNIAKMINNGTENHSLEQVFIVQKIIEY